MSKLNPALPGAEAPETPAPILAERRAALAKLGLMAGYTAPAMLSLLITRRSSAASEGQPPPPNF